MKRKIFAFLVISLISLKIFAQASQIRIGLLNGPTCVPAAYLMENKKHFIITFAPAILCTAIAIAYILQAPEGFGLDSFIANLISVIITAIISIFFIWKYKKQLSEINYFLSYLFSYLNFFTIFLFFNHLFLNFFLFIVHTDLQDIKEIIPFDKIEEFYNQYL